MSPIFQRGADVSTMIFQKLNEIASISDYEVLIIEPLNLPTTSLVKQRLYLPAGPA